MFPRFAKFLSTTLGHLIVGVSGLIYIINLWRQPSATVSTLGLSALFVLAALSGLCFTMAPMLEDEGAEL